MNLPNEFSVMFSNFEVRTPIKDYIILRVGVPYCFLLFQGFNCVAKYNKRCNLSLGYILLSCLFSYIFVNTVGIRKMPCLRNVVYRWDVVEKIGCSLARNISEWLRFKKKIEIVQIYTAGNKKRDLNPIDPCR